MSAITIVGIDPGLRCTGWGIIAHEGVKVSHVSHGVIRPPVDLPLECRLLKIYEGLSDVIMHYNPQEASVEKVFVNKNPSSTLLLGQARGIALLVPAFYKLSVFEYDATQIKKTITGGGRSAKEQVQAMISVLLPGVDVSEKDASDALAVAVCHAIYPHGYHR